MKPEIQFVDIQQTAGNAAITLDPIQRMLEPHVEAITVFWFVLWLLTGVVMLWKLYVEYRTQKRLGKE